MMRLSSNKGVTLAEALLAGAILAFVLCGILATYISCLELIAIARNLTAAINAAQEKLEEIRDYSFSLIYSDYNNQSFTVSGIPQGAKGVIYVDDSNPELLKVTVSVSWLNRSNRVIGEDANLNGILDSGEDLNGNSIIDSPAQVVTLITSR